MGKKEGTSNEGIITPNSTLEVKIDTTITIKIENRKDVAEQ